MLRPRALPVPSEVWRCAPRPPSRDCDARDGDDRGDLDAKASSSRSPRSTRALWATSRPRGRPRRGPPWRRLRPGPAPWTSRLCGAPWGPATRKAARRLFETVDETRSGVYRAELIANLAPSSTARRPVGFRDVVRDAAFVWGERAPATSAERTIKTPLVAQIRRHERPRVRRAVRVVSRAALPLGTYTATAPAARPPSGREPRPPRQHDDDDDDDRARLGRTARPRDGADLGAGRRDLGHAGPSATAPSACATSRAPAKLRPRRPAPSTRACASPCDAPAASSSAQGGAAALFLTFQRGAGARPATQAAARTCDKPNSISNATLVVGGDARAAARRDAQLGVDYEVLREGAGTPCTAGTARTSFCGGPSSTRATTPSSSSLIFVDVFDDAGGSSRRSLSASTTRSARRARGREPAAPRWGKTPETATTSGTRTRRAPGRVQEGEERPPRPSTASSARRRSSPSSAARPARAPRTRPGRQGRRQGGAGPVGQRWSFHGAPTGAKAAQGDDRGGNEEQMDAGLCNLGNTCYMNATIQALAHAPPIRDYFIRASTPTRQRRDRYSPSALAASGDLVAALGSKKGPVAPSSAVVGKFDATFAGYGQQDAARVLQQALGRARGRLERHRRRRQALPREPPGRRRGRDLDGVLDSEEPELRAFAGDLADGAPSRAVLGERGAARGPLCDGGADGQTRSL